MTGHERPPDVAETRKTIRNWNWVVLGAGVMALAVALASQSYGHDAAEQRDVARAGLETAESRAMTAEQRKQELVDRAIALCDPNDPVVERLRAVGLCDIAAEEKAQPDATPAPSVPFSVVREVVAAYLQANPPPPGKTPTPEELLPVIEQALKRNPPKDGRTPTEAELLVLIQQVYAASPPPAGRDGKDGQNAFCYDNPTAAQCQPQKGEQGVKGDQGVQGPGIDLVTLQPRGEQCFLVVVFTPYADGRQQPQSEIEVDPVLCYEPPVPTVGRR